MRTFLLELRKSILNITIEELTQCMNWSNEKYYNKIVNGQIDKKDNCKKYSEPTVKWLFESLNHAFKYSKEFQINKNKVMELIHKYIIRF